MTSREPRLHHHTARARSRQGEGEGRDGVAVVGAHSSTRLFVVALRDGALYQAHELTLPEQVRPKGVELVGTQLWVLVANAPAAIALPSATAAYEDLSIAIFDAEELVEHAKATEGEAGCRDARASLAGGQDVAAVLTALEGMRRELGGQIEALGALVGRRFDAIERRLEAQEGALAKCRGDER